jgi:hypothetical protein
MASPNFSALAANYDPNSAMYKELMGFAANPAAANNPAIAQSLAGSLQYPAMPSVVGTLPDGSPASVPYNATSAGNVTNLATTAPGSVGVPNAPAGSLIYGANVLDPGATPTPVPQSLLNPAPAGSPQTVQPGAGTPGVQIGRLADGTPSWTGSSTGTAANGSTPGMGSSSGLPLNIGGLDLGSLNTSALLPAILASGMGLWSYLGSSDKYNNAGNLVNNAETAAGQQVNQTAQGAAGSVNQATGVANNTLANLFSQTGGNLTPYQEGGTAAEKQITSGLAPGGALNQNLTPDQILQQNPGYQFRLGQGAQGIENAMAAEGRTDSGAAQKALADYEGQSADSAYQQAFQNQQTQQQNLFGNLYNTAGLGSTANSQDISAASQFGAPQASNTINSSMYGGNMDVTGSQYQGNANVTGAGAQAGAQIDIAQQQQAFIQQLMTSMLSLFNTSQNGNGNPLPNPFGLTGSDNSLSGVISALTGA